MSDVPVERKDFSDFVGRKPVAAQTNPRFALHLFRVAIQDVAQHSVEDGLAFLWIFDDRVAERGLEKVWSGERQVSVKAFR